VAAEIDGGRITTADQVVSRLYLATREPTGNPQADEVVVQLGMPFSEAVNRLGRFSIEVGPDNARAVTPPEGFSSYWASSRKWHHALVITKRDDDNTITSIAFYGDNHSDERLPLLLRMDQNESVQRLTISDLRLGKIDEENKRQKD
jgi:hypothetical protein